MYVAHCTCIFVDVTYHHCQIVNPTQTTPLQLIIPVIHRLICRGSLYYMVNNIIIMLSNTNIDFIVFMTDRWLLFDIFIIVISVLKKINLIRLVRKFTENALIF